MPDETRHEPIEEELDGIARSIGGEKNQRPIQAELLEIILALGTIRQEQTVESHAIRQLTEQIKLFSSQLSEINSKLDTLIQAVIPPTETVSIKFGVPTPIAQEK